MAVYQSTTPAVDGVRFGARPFRFLSSMLSALTEWNNKRITRKALNNLTARELQDIGLSRSDLESL